MEREIMARKEFLLISLAMFSFVTICFLWMQSLAYGQKLHEIRAEIQKKGARWEAGDNPLSLLSFADQQKRLGLVRPVHTGLEPRLNLEAEAPLFEAPASLDWRNHGGNFVTSIRDQGSCGSCWAFAATAALEATTLIANQTPGVDLNLSEQVMVSCGNAGSCGGGSIDSASNYIKNTGLPLETCYPYTATNGACANACASWQSSAYRISSWHYVATTQATVEGIKNALYNNGPLVTTMAVYQDFFSYRSGVYSYVSGSLAGYHAVLIVGYDDPGQYFIVKNSWGTWWGEAGYFRIAYSELNSVVGFGDWTIAYVGLSPACSYNVGPPSPSSFPASGGNGSILVDTSSDCPWTASGNDRWITITSGASGTGPGTVSFLVNSNSGTSSRTGSLRVAGQTVTVSQEAGATCTYTLKPTQQDITAVGGTGSVGVTTATGCPWTASSNDASWITVTAGSSGWGNGTVVYSVAAQSSTSPRTGALTIAGSTFRVNQAGVPCTYSISPTSKSFSANAGNGSVNVTSLTGCGWSAVSSAGWITMLSGQSGSGNGNVSYSVAANSSSSSRTGTLTVGGQTHTITQAASGGVPVISVSPASLKFGYVGINRYSSKVVKVTNNGSAPLDLQSVTIGGTHANQFSETHGCAQLAPGQSCPITVTFSPTTAGNKSAALQIYSNDPVRNSVSVPLSGKTLR
jgi:C1A family cysteine protease